MLTVLAAAAVLVVALVLIVITGALVYVRDGPLEPITRRRRQRFSRSYPDYVDGSRGNGDTRRRRRVGAAVMAVGRATRRVDADFEAIRAAGGSLYARIASEVGEVSARLGARDAATKDEGMPTGAVRTLEGRLGPYPSEGTRHAKPDDPNATQDTRAAPSRSLADDELEMLKAKLHKPDEATAPDLLKRKLTEGGAPRKAVAKDALEVASLKAKLEVAHEPAKDMTASSIAAETPDAPQTGHGAGSASVRPSLPPRESLRRAAPPAARAPKPATATEGVATPIELRAPARRAERPPGREQPGSPGQLATKCRIEWWRGYFMSLFYAAAKTPAGESVLAESPHFRWRKADPPPRENAQAVQAHRSLLEVLERDGWSVARAGKHWFAVELERRGPRRRSNA